MKVCFDVWDGNFAALFAESPEAVRERCEILVQKLRPLPSVNVVAPGATDLDFALGPADWVVYSGFEPFDYMLPSGEVACRPRDASGVLDIDGWIVGSLPFGQKYGRIRAGAAILKIKDGAVVDLLGNDSRLCADLEHVFSSFSLTTIGELGVGQSIAVAELADEVTVGYQWHERHRGVHVGLGAELPETLSAEDRVTDYHLDIVLSSGLLRSGATTIESW
jgi:leucyl aminopeptidase (aminopeptidase T)